MFLQNPGKLTASFPAVIALALLGTMALWAGAAGSLLGTVTDPGGAAVAAARVTATETATGVAHTLLTDAQGFYSFQSLPVGYYDVLIDASGFRPLKRTGVVLDVDRKVVVDASLTIGERTEAITVSYLEPSRCPAR